MARPPWSASKDRDTNQVRDEVVTATGAETLQDFVEENTEADATI